MTSLICTVQSKIVMLMSKQQSDDELCKIRAGDSETLARMYKVSNLGGVSPKRATVRPRDCGSYVSYKLEIYYEVR